MSRQSVLPFRYDDQHRLDWFCTTGNETVVQEIELLLEGHRSRGMLYLWGESGTGKTHLLNGCCALADKNGKPYCYLPFTPNQIPDLPDQVVPGTLVCIDDIHYGLNEPDVQNQLLTLFEQTTLSGGALIVAANQPPASLSMNLDDLRSRLVSGGVFHLTLMGDSAKRQWLQRHAHYRGFRLSNHVLSFIMSHCQRDTRSLFELLDQIDNVSLAEKRRVTVALVKSLL